MNDAVSGSALPQGAPLAGAAPDAPVAPAMPRKQGARSVHSDAAARPEDGAIAAIDAALVTARLEDAGRTLLALPDSGPSPRLRVSVWDVLQSAIEGYGWEQPRMRAAVPAAARITRMDEALGWIALIPRDRYVLRRIVGARALVHPLTDRHIYPWRRLGAAVGADHKAVQRWHAQGIALIVAALRGRG